MILEMKVPSPGESITEVEIAQWLVAEGDYIQKDQAIAEVDSDKATLELPAETSGTISLKAEEGDSVAVGSVVCLIDTEGKPLGGESSSSAQVEKNPVVNTLPTPIVKSSYATGTASIAAKKIISEKGIDIDSLIGSGRDGRITKDDAVKAVAAMGSAPKGANRGEERKKLSMLRRKVAERLVSVKNETAMLTTFNEANMAPIFALRKSIRRYFPKSMVLGLDL
jgi:2-oxoglutarate dehydrogenase E2 component (dihydrolipoamide succinyltransferase)